MLISMHKVMGVKCCACNSNNFIKINPFKLNSKLAIVCEICNQQFISVQKNKKNNYIIEIKCYICEEIHKYEISYNAFWKSDIFAFGCHESSIDICYVGDIKQVAEAMDKLDDNLENLVRDLGDISNLSEIMEKALFTIEDMAKSNKIICLCGNYELEATLKGDGILISCAGCRANEFIKTNTQEDLDILIDRKIIVLV